MGLEQEPVAIELPLILFVEGQDEVKVFARLLTDLGREHEIQVINAGGRDRFKTAFPGYVLQEGFRRVTSLAVVQDADEGVAPRFQSISNVLQKYDLPVPAGAGQFADHEGRRTGVYLLPDNVRAGCLEDLFLESMSDAGFRAYVTQYVDGLPGILQVLPVGHPRVPATFYVPRRPAKAKALAALAGTEDPVNRLGLAAEQHYWNFGHVAFDALRGFLQQL